MSAALVIQERARLESLLSASSSDPAVLATALVVAFFLGAAHALTPGHGKAIVAAYMAGSRGRLADAVYLGGVVTVTHTITVFVLGLAALYASQQVALERIYPWLNLTSGLVVAGIGGWLLVVRTRSTHAHRHPHPHEHAHATGQPGKGSLLTLGVSGGLAPCPEALVVLLVSISLGRLALGLAILVAFSAGLAAVLIGIGTAMVMTGPLMRRFAVESRWMRALPVASAAVVTGLGLVIAAQALVKL